MASFTTQKIPKAIPKLIHCCWFGNGIKGKLIDDCMKSWDLKLPDYEIVEWNESNFDVNAHPYTKCAVENKRWAFVSDYARLKILYEHGGIYLDTDMYVLKSFNDFIDTNYELVLGKEDNIHISAGMIAATPHHPYVLDLLNYYDTQYEFVTIPRILTKVYEENKHNYNQSKIKIFEFLYFYPFSANEIKNFTVKNFTVNDKNGAANTTAPTESYAVHMWNYSWGHPLVKLSKKLHLHSLAHTVANALGITKLIKRIFKVV